MSQWSDQEVSILTRMAFDGRPTSEMSARLNRTRNSVIGYIHRHHIPWNYTVRNLALERRERLQQLHVKRRMETLALKKAAMPPPPIEYVPPEPTPEPATEPASAPTANGITMLTLRDKHCRYIIGDPRNADFHFCGFERVAGSSYCKDHITVCYMPMRGRG